MDIRTFAELTTPDERSLPSTPWGLATGRKPSPEYAAASQQRSIAAANLVPAVPEGVRSSFERLRTLHAYGLLCYDLFTVVDDLRWVVLEQALRERFVAFYGGVIPIVRIRDGAVDTFPTTDLEAMNAAFRKRGSHEGWRLRPNTPGEPIQVPLNLNARLRWARREGLLHGQRNRRFEEKLYDKIRNRFAHGGGFRIEMPNQSARAIHDLAQIINRLWGALTPGGRLYPTPVQRDVLVIGWSSTGSTGLSKEIMHAEQLAGEAEAGDWMYLIVRGVWDTPQLWDFDARYEFTPYPTDLLWGPGTRSDALAWWEAPAPTGDEVTYLDRVFAVRRHDGRVAPPCRPEVLLGLPPEHRAGTWHVVRADFPGDAVAHVRHIDAGQPCGPEGCAVQDIASGSWEDAVASVRNLFPDVQAAVYSEARVPQRLP